MSDTIIPLQGPDRVRKRPAVIFGSDGLDGAQQAVREVLNIFLTQAQLGHCSRLNVKQEGAQLEIRGNDRGLDLGQDTADDTKWQALFGRLYPMPAQLPDQQGYSFGLTDCSHHILYGDTPDGNALYLPEDCGFLELYALQCVCSFLDVSVNRGGIHSTLRFERGHNISGICSRLTDDPDGTCFRFRLDPEVFTETLIPAGFFEDQLESYAMLSPGLCCTYENEDSQAKTFCCPDGISDYVRAKTSAPVFRKKLTAKGRDRYDRAEYEACVDIAIGFTPETGEFKCYHNFRELTCGGSHREQVQRQLAGAFSCEFDTVAPHLTVVLASWCSPHCTVWRNGERTAIENRMIADLAYDAVSTAFRDYLFCHKEVFRAFLDRVLTTEE